MKSTEQHVLVLIEKAAASEDKDDAMRFSQAALNAAHAAQVLYSIKNGKASAVD